MNKELEGFAAMLGRQINKFAPEAPASEDYIEIAEFRLSQILGLAQDSEEFGLLWEKVIHRAYEYVEGDDGDPAELPGNTALPERAYAGMPYARWEIMAYDDHDKPIARFIIQARTHVEAQRLSHPDVMRVPRMHMVSSRRLQL